MKKGNTTTFFAPWDWRRGLAIPYQLPDVDDIQPAYDNEVGECLIKGNISSRGGERIYHVPGGAYFDRTIIDPSKGERWFCTEAEAQATGGIFANQGRVAQKHVRVHRSPSCWRICIYPVWTWLSRYLSYLAIAGIVR